MTRRTEKASQAIKETVSTTILLGLRDPRIKNVTVLRAEVSPDLRRVDIFVSVMGEDNVKALSLQGLNSSRGFLQSKIADRIQTKNTPVITFKMEDAGTSAAVEAARILQELEAERFDAAKLANPGNIDSPIDIEDDHDASDDYEIEDDAEPDLNEAESLDADASSEVTDESEAVDEASDLDEDKESAIQLGQNP
jgi:ribosome-binding factor A